MENLGSLQGTYRKWTNFEKKTIRVELTLAVKSGEKQHNDSKVMLLSKTWVFALVLVGRARHRSTEGGSMSRGKSDAVGSLSGSL